MAATRWYEAKAGSRPVSSTNCGPQVQARTVSQSSRMDVALASEDPVALVRFLAATPIWFISNFHSTIEGGSCVQGHTETVA